MICQWILEKKLVSVNFGIFWVNVSENWNLNSIFSNFFSNFLILWSWIISISRAQSRIVFWNWKTTRISVKLCQWKTLFVSEMSVNCQWISFSLLSGHPERSTRCSVWLQREWVDVRHQFWGVVYRGLPSNVTREVRPQ